MQNQMGPKKPFFYTLSGVIVLSILIASAMLVWLSATILNVALPPIEYQLNATLNELQWAVNVFTLCGGLIIVSGRLADVFGRKRVLNIGLLLFILGSFIGGFTNHITILIIARAIQGIGGALILPPSLALVEVNFHPPQRTIAIGLWIGLAWFAMAIGPAIGGLVLEIADWRWIMWILVPFGGIILFLSTTFLKESKNSTELPRIDYIGSLIVMLSMFGITYAAIESGVTGWLSPLTLSMLCFGLLLAIIFIIIEKRVSNPVLAIDLLCDRTFLGANLVNAVSNITFASILFFSAIYLEIVGNYSALSTGLLLLPATLSILITLNIGSVIYNRIGAKAPTTIGMIMLTIGLLVISMKSESAGYAGLLGPFVLIGLGIGLFASPITAAALAASSHDDAGRAAGLFKASSMIGAAIGIAIAGSVYQHHADRLLNELAADHGHETRYIMRKIIGGNKDDFDALQQYAPDQFDALREITLSIINSAYQSTILFLMLICLTCTIIGGLLIPRRHHFYAATKPGPRDPIPGRPTTSHEKRFDWLRRPNKTSKPSDTDNQADNI
ncbi:Multidrug resistance protein stp [Poriferisphaera corsica]|uniref:Multidrug resistance protein stp n=1 Tax=Poriferisphaera corsica TaxID=2528020 RepID=A0A517YQS0_9BACT|nr:MFS transporter [Poriferisphaera corsica]QDU32577.1 Multidrug resistance protein stp [Poriferisphaera corsica]